MAPRPTHRPRGPFSGVGDDWDDGRGAATLEPFLRRSLFLLTLLFGVRKTTNSQYLIIMEYLTLLGESAYTASIAQKIKDLINKTGAAKVDDVSAVYVHYAHLKQAARDEARVSSPRYLIIAKIVWAYISLSYDASFRSFYPMRPRYMEASALCVTRYK